MFATHQLQFYAFLHSSKDATKCSFSFFFLQNFKYYSNILLANNRIVNIPIKIIMPENMIQKFIPKGLNQDPFGAIINISPKIMDNKLLKILIIIIKLVLIFLDVIPAKIISEKVPKNANKDPFLFIDVSI